MLPTKPKNFTATQPCVQGDHEILGSSSKISTIERIRVKLAEDVQHEESAESLPMPRISSSQ
jgi:hypothetical protein